MIKTLLVLFPLTDGSKAALRAALPDTEIIFTTHDGFTPDELRRADVIFGNIAVSALIAAS